MALSVAQPPQLTLVAHMHYSLPVLFLISISSYGAAATSSVNATARAPAPSTNSSIIARVLKSFFPKPVSKELMAHLNNSSASQSSASVTPNPPHILEEVEPIITFQEFYSSLCSYTMITNVLNKFLADHQNVRIENQVNCFFALFNRAPLDSIKKAIKEYSIAQKILEKLGAEELFGMITESRFNASEIKDLLIVTERYTPFYWGQRNFLEKLRIKALKDNNYVLLSYTNEFPDEIEEIKYHPELLFQEKDLVPSSHIVTSIFGKATKKLAYIALNAEIYPKSSENILNMPSLTNKATRSKSGLVAGGWNIGMILLAYEKYDELISILQSVSYLKNKCGESTVITDATSTFSSIKDMIPFIPDKHYRQKLAGICGISDYLENVAKHSKIGLNKLSTIVVPGAAVQSTSKNPFDPEFEKPIRNNIVRLLLE